MHLSGRIFAFFFDDVGNFPSTVPFRRLRNDLRVGKPRLLRVGQQRVHHRLGKFSAHRPFLRGSSRNRHGHVGGRRDLPEDHGLRLPSRLFPHFEFGERGQHHGRGERKEKVKKERSRFRPDVEIFVAAARDVASLGEMVVGPIDLDVGGIRFGLFRIRDGVRLRPGRKGTGTSAENQMQPFRGILAESGGPQAGEIDRGGFQLSLHK